MAEGLTKRQARQYNRAHRTLIEGALAAQDMFDVDELERYADEIANRAGAARGVGEPVEEPSSTEGVSRPDAGPETDHRG